MSSAHPMLLDGVSARSVAVDLALFLLLALVWMLSMEGAASLLIASGLVTGEPLVNLVATLTGGLGAVFILLMLIRQRGQSISSLGLCSRDFAIDVLWGLVAVPAAFAAHFLGIGITLTFIPGAWEMMTQNAENLHEYMPDLPVMGFAAVFIGVSFYEEVIFRGFLLTRLRRIAGNWPLAAPASAAIFALLHLGLQEPTALPSLFLLALTFALFTIWRQSLIPAIVGHWAFNTLMIAGLQWVWSHQEPVV